MRWITLELDEALMDEAMKLSGETTRAAVIHRALGDLIRHRTALRIRELRGCGEWDGDLAEMRRDAT